MPTIYSTLTEDQLYTNYRKNGDQNTIEKSVLIRGGHGKIDRRTLITPLGVGTEVTDEELAILEANPSFRDHRDNGFLTVLSKKSDPEKVASSMNQKDPSRQKTEADYEDGSSTADENAGIPRKAKRKKE